MLQRPAAALFHCPGNITVDSRSSQHRPARSEWQPRCTRAGRSLIVGRQIAQPTNQDDERIPVLRCHDIIGTYVHFGEPCTRQIAAVRPRLFRHVTGNIRELERQAQISGPVRRVLVPGGYTHDDRHHATDGTGDVFAIS